MTFTSFELDGIEIFWLGVFMMVTRTWEQVENIIQTKKYREH